MPERCEGILQLENGNGDRWRPGMPPMPASCGCGPAAHCGWGIGMEYECDLRLKKKLEPPRFAKKLRRTGRLRRYSQMAEGYDAGHPQHNVPHKKNTE